MSSRALLLDKDGTLVENLPFNVDLERIRFMPGAARAVTRLARAGIRMAVVSNQPGVAFGYFPESALAGVERRLRGLFAQCGAELDGFHYCPHHPNATVVRYRCACGCRKPNAGLVQRALAAMHVDPGEAWMVGDILDDVEAAHAAGCRAILFDSGGETEWRTSPLRTPDHVTRRFATVADIVLGTTRATA
jgi:D-glycero-D-manno-heptose 1,7-bisphosphate phosphatase